MRVRRKLIKRPLTVSGAGVQLVLSFSLAESRSGALSVYKFYKTDATNRSRRYLDVMEVIMDDTIARQLHTHLGKALAELAHGETSKELKLDKGEDDSQ